MPGLFTLRREMSDDKIRNVGRRFIEKYHWHSLKPLSDDYDRTKIGKISPSLLNLRVNQHIFKLHCQYISFQMRIKIYKMNRNMLALIDATAIHWLMALINQKL